jgi:RNA polymerase sigma-70 factor (ECF subfamily)
VDTQTSELELRGLATASLDGDGEAHRELLNRLSGRLRAYFKTRLMRIGHGVVEAEDLVQEVLIAVHTRRHTYDRTQPFTPWLYAIAKYKFLDYLRRAKTSMQDDPVEHAQALMARDDHAEVESTLDVERLMERLPAKVRQAMRDVTLDGMSVAEAAARSRMTPSALKVSVHRGVKALARALRKESKP